ncbi:uncharacterized protein LOC132707682 [Cylas formicarius]|uniref:uncharacterized protein LOC132707682 n=1 Tax=Cylas formicarius TaxID=197179 RepID=UPI0029586D8A|nr:uncharacterized protein LOC132707682 [Cylas formicarius]
MCQCQLLVKFPKMCFCFPVKAVIPLVKLVLVINSCVLIALGLVGKFVISGISAIYGYTYCLISGSLLLILCALGCFFIKINVKLMTTLYIALLAADCCLNLLFSSFVLDRAVRTNTQDTRNFLADVYLKARREPEALLVAIALGKHFECCGIEGAQDAVVRLNSDNELLISGCCKERERRCTRKQAFKDGCKKRFGKFYKDVLLMMGIFLLFAGMGVFILFRMMLTLCLKPTMV